MEIINETPLQETKKSTYAGFWWRLLAHIIDNIIISFVSWIIILPVLGVFGISVYSMMNSGVTMDDPEIWLGPVLMAYFSIISLSVAISWLYYSLMESSVKQGTVGKMVLNIKVTDMEGQRISFLKATGRYFGKIISGFIFMIGYIMAGFTDKKQALHDIMAGCLVIKE